MDKRQGLTVVEPFTALVVGVVVVVEDVLVTVARVLFQTADVIHYRCGGGGDYYR